MVSASTARRQGRALRPKRRASASAPWGESKEELVSGSIEVANRAAANQVITTRVTLRNDASIINQFDPDSCEVAPAVQGYSLEVRLYADGRQVDAQQTCLRGIGGRNEIEFDYTTPNEDTQVDLSFEVETTSSNRLVAEGSQTVYVEKSDDDEDEEAPPRQGDCPDGQKWSESRGVCVPVDGGGGGGGGGGGPWLPCFLDPNRKCNTSSAVAYGIGGVSFGLILLQLFIPV